MKYSIYIIVTLFFILGSLIGEKMNPEKNLLWLKNDRVEVGILPEVGGRIVILRQPGGINLLKANPLQWEKSEQQKPEILPDASFVPFNGHIVWLGPQQAWWQHQQLNQERRERKAVWPPDPYLIYGKYNLREESENYVKLIGPKSLVSGVQLIKEIWIKADGSVEFSATAVGLRDNPVTWDIWMNTRMEGFDRAYVPVTDTTIIELMKKSTEIIETTPFEISDGYFTYQPSIPEKTEQVQEAHIEPHKNFIIGQKDNNLLVISFEIVSGVSPGHSQVEIYNSITRESDLLELEVHGAYKSIEKDSCLTMQIQFNIDSLRNQSIVDYMNQWESVDFSHKNRGS